MALAASLLAKTTTLSSALLRPDRVHIHKSSTSKWCFIKANRQCENWGVTDIGADAAQSAMSGVMQ